MARLIVPPATLLAPLILAPHIETGTLLLLSVVLRLERDRVQIVVRRNDRTIIAFNGRLSTENSTAALINLPPGNQKVGRRWWQLVLLLTMLLPE